MKLFQQLLVAPAALGLMAPVAATAADLNVNGVSQYSNSGEIESISQFSDVYPTDWAYQALTNLAERHGCVASSPNGSMTRYEAAALLNKCLGNVAQVNEEERRLLNEFGPELAVIKGRLDGLEARVGEFEAGVFSSTTKLSGRTIFNIGGISTNEGTATTNNPHQNEAVNFHYDTAISLDTSFDGNDLLTNRIRVSNGSSTQPFGSAGVAALESAHGTGAADTMLIDRSYYQFPVGDKVTATIGAKVRQDDMLGVWPSAYPSDAVLDVLTYAGANDAYSLASGVGGGVTWADENLSASLLFISENGANSSSQEATAGGILSAHGSDDVTGQVAWLGDGITLAAAYTIADNGNQGGAVDANDYSAFGLSGIYELENSLLGLDSEWLPTSISAGMGWKTPDKEDNPDTSANAVEDSTTWTVGLIWNDAFVDGNNLGWAVGTAEGHRDDSGYDDPLAWEIYYQMAVSDNISVTPALFVIQRDDTRNDDITGAVVKTTFSF